MKFINTLAAARERETTTWAVADGLVQDFLDAGVSAPTTLHFKEASEVLDAFDYLPTTLTEYWRTASVFGKSRRKKGIPLSIYRKLVIKLWASLDPETRSNDLVAYAAQFFAERPSAPVGRYAGDGEWSARTAEKWAVAQAAALTAERKKREEAAAKKATKERLAKNEKLLAEAIASGDEDEIENVLAAVNLDRKRLGMDLLKFDKEEAVVETDEEATEEAQQEDDSERLHFEAKVEIEAAIANLDRRIAYLGNTFLRVQDHLTLEDRDAYTEEIGLSEGRLALVRAQVNGTASDEALAAALAEWDSETTNG